MRAKTSLKFFQNGTHFVLLFLSFDNSFLQIQDGKFHSILLGLGRKPLISQAKKSKYNSIPNISEPQVLTENKKVNI